MENCLKSCFTRLKISPKASLYVTVGNYQENYAKILNQLHSLTEDPENLKRAIKTYEGAIEAYDKVGWHSYVAKIHWQTCNNLLYRLLLWAWLLLGLP